MTDSNFVPTTKPHQPGEFALQWVPWAGHDLARMGITLHAHRFSSSRG